MQVLSICNASVPPHLDAAAGTRAVGALLDFAACSRLQQLELIGIYDDAHLPRRELALPPHLTLLNLEGAPGSPLPCHACRLFAK